MDTSPVEWINLVLRWMHVIAAIFWIGHAFLFNELDDTLVPPRDDDDREGLEGEMWMVHGGGFYHLEKSWAWPDALRGELKWFRWESAATWTTGFLLLVVVFWMGGGVYLFDPATSPLSAGQAIGVSVGALALGLAVYEGLCRTPLIEHTVAFAAVGLAGITGLSWALTELLTGRAAFLHVGAVLATLMAANVWIVIIPSMREMVAIAREEGRIPVHLGKRAKQRSKHNNYIVFPVIFLMISNHYPTLYGADLNWALVPVMVVIGAAVKHAMNKRGDGIGVWLGFGIAAAGALLLLGLRSLPAAGEAAPDAPAGTQVIDPDTAGTLQGVVRFEGSVPEPRVVQLVNCPQQGPAELQPVRVQDGRLADVFVWVEDGLEGYAMPPAPDTEVVVDQRGCLYEPTVIGARVGQPIAFLNSDPVPHNVRAVADANPTFNEMMVQQDSRIVKTFRKPEIMIEARCDIHPWMSAHLGILPHPFFGVTGPAGRVDLQGLPPGQYTVGAWHQVYGEREQQVTVPPSGTAEVTFTFGDGD